MKKITAILMGAGLRGMDAYADYALRNENEIQFVAVAEPDRERRVRFQKLHHIPAENCFENWEQILAVPKLADAALICTQDQMHFKPTMKAMEMGYDILLEKPMSTSPKECMELGKYANEHKRILCICYVLRYTPFFMALKKLVESGRIGKLISVQHNENVGYWHMAHSFVRGNWRNSDESSPMILQKSCHDMDILRWLIGADCVNMSSFGDLSYFKEENAPSGAPLRCLDGCKYKNECAYYAPKLYLTEDTDWPTSAISNDHSYQARVRALKEGPYGRCVFQCDNNVVDHQVVNMEFANGATAAFTMCAFTNEISRTIKLMGTKGEIRGAMEKNEIEIKEFGTGITDVMHIQETESGHSGGDDGIMKDFISLLQAGKTDVDYCIDNSVHSHIMAFAAEKARAEKKVINIEEYKSQFAD
ncbi:Gfo/Idh/MocA family protein [Caproiciproducens galactitolivorans]|uniref:Gfo/Idh/MocA family oxidoreductase n=1 Tax=Caproiciproducens galactitolivorans TaxID=642589 RepID=A0ABT4BXX8_9FIRM|nr:Gfo/Idh/MocA family oxidoreductase [Caproiciproducens galactitolivorans]MCY1715180.1 Gfo/Idh/MocA family oxidoreductase [Caproiciproducens galactitolivorans]